MQGKVAISFEDLSNEMVVQILHFCSYTTILQFAGTCHRYLNLVANTTSLQLHIQLESNGLEIVSGSSSGRENYSTILDELRRYQSAWLDLNLSPPIKFPQDDLDPPLLLWELREGGYFKAFSSSGMQQPDSLQSISLGSNLLDPPSPVHFHIDYHEFTLDPKQDLAALVRVNPQRSHCAEVHLRSTSTGLQHPLAQYPMITVELGFTVPWGRPFSIALEIADNILIVKFSDVFSRIYDILVWDWTSATLLHRIDSQSGICDFSLLSRDYLVLYSAAPYEESEFLVLQQLHLLVYEISSAHSNRAAPPDVHVHAPSFPTLRPTLKLELPKLRNNMSVAPTGFLLRSDPVPGRILYTGSAAFSFPRALTLGLTMSLYKLPAAVDSTALRIFVSTAHLFEYLQKHNGGETVTVPWNEWGKQSTRWFIDDIEPDFWFCWMSGSRYVRATHTRNFEGTFEGTQELSVVDFHTPTIKRYATRTLDPNTSVTRTSVHRTDNSVVRAGRGLTISRTSASTADTLTDAATTSDEVALEETVGSDIPTVIEGMFEAPIESRLPYRIVTKAAPVPSHHGWLIGGDHILGINSMDDISIKVSVYKLRVPSEE